MSPPPICPTPPSVKCFWMQLGPVHMLHECLGAGRGQRAGGGLRRAEDGQLPNEGRSIKG